MVARRFSPTWRRSTRSTSLARCAWSSPSGHAAGLGRRRAAGTGLRRGRAGRVRRHHRAAGFCRSQRRDHQPRAAARPVEGAARPGRQPHPDRNGAAGCHPHALPAADRRQHRGRSTAGRQPAANPGQPVTIMPPRATRLRAARQPHRSPQVSAAQSSAPAGVFLPAVESSAAGTAQRLPAAATSWSTPCCGSAGRPGRAHPLDGSQARPAQQKQAVNLEPAPANGRGASKRSAIREI